MFREDFLSRYAAGSLERFKLDASDLSAFYWRIRASRRSSERRRWYRKAQKEKARLAGLGYESEVIRLYCLALKQPRLERRWNRFFEVFEESKEWPKQMTLDLS